MQDLPETRASLLLKMQQSERDAWAEFVAIYRPAIYRIARRRGWQDADAQDLTQQVMVKVANAIGRFEPDGSRAKFRTWLFAISRNTMVDALRRVRPDAGRGGTTELTRLTNHVAEEELESEFSIEYRRQVFHWAAAQTREAFSASSWRAF